MQRYWEEHRHVHQLFAICLILRRLQITGCAGQLCRNGGNIGRFDFRGPGRVVVRRQEFFEVDELRALFQELIGEGKSAALARTIGGEASLFIIVAMAIAFPLLLKPFECVLKTRDRAKGRDGDGEIDLVIGARPPEHGRIAIPVSTPETLALEGEIEPADPG